MTQLTALERDLLACVERLVSYRCITAFVAIMVHHGVSCDLEQPGLYLVLGLQGVQILERLGQSILQDVIDVRCGAHPGF